MCSPGAPACSREDEDPADLRVGVGEEAGEDLLLAGVHPSLVGAEVGPGLDPARAAAVSTVPSGHDARLARWRAKTSWRQASQPLSNMPAVGVDPLGGDVVGRVHGAEGEVQEERLARRALLLVLHHADGLVGQVLAQVVPVLGSARRLDVVVVADQVRRPVVGVALQEAVVALEAHAERPGVERARRPSAASVA